MYRQKESLNVFIEQIFEFVIKGKHFCISLNSKKQGGMLEAIQNMRVATRRDFVLSAETKLELFSHMNSWYVWKKSHIKKKQKKNVTHN